MKARSVLLILTVAAGVLALGGCQGDVDPQAKVDAPGYYNGPMEPRGGGDKGGEKAPDAEGSQTGAGGQ